MTATLSSTGDRASPNGRAKTTPAANTTFGSSHALILHDVAIVTDLAFLEGSTYPRFQAISLWGYALI
jgi:hypothetical protein